MKKPICVPCPSHAVSSSFNHLTVMNLLKRQLILILAATDFHNCYCQATFSSACKGTNVFPDFFSCCITDYNSITA